MNYKTKEIIKNEMKALAFKRRTSKRRSRELAKEAGKILKTMYEDGKMVGRYWDDENWKCADIRLSASHELRSSGANTARYYNIAYGLLRGTSYKLIENKCDVAPNPEEVYKIILKHIPIRETKDWSIDKIKNLLQ